jgi:hypothetical protein
MEVFTRQVFSDFDGDRLEVSAYGRERGLQVAALRINSGRSYHTSSLTVPALCRALHEAAGLVWPEDGPVLVHSGSKPNRVIYAVEPDGTKHMVSETIPPTPAEQDALEDRGWVPFVMPKLDEDQMRELREAIQKGPHGPLMVLEPDTPDLSGLKAALEGSMVALDDMMQRFAAELCEPERVRVAIARIRANGGTLAYITAVQERNRKALAAERAGLLTEETKREPEPLEVAERAAFEAWLISKNVDVSKVSPCPGWGGRIYLHDAVQVRWEAWRQSALAAIREGRK